MDIYWIISLHFREIYFREILFCEYEIFENDLKFKNLCYYAPGTLLTDEDGYPRR